MKKLIIILMMFLANNVLADSYNCTTTGMYTNCNGGGNSGGSDLTEIIKLNHNAYSDALRTSQEAELRAIEIENAKYELEIRKLQMKKMQEQNSYQPLYNNQ